MELDKRIIEGKKPLTCFDIEEAREFEGKEGYFCDYPRAFAYGDAPLEKCATTGILELDVDRDYSICPYINKTTCLNYPYFLPAAWIKPEEPEKKYRPYKNVQELFEDIGVYIGDTIHFRSKAKETESHSLITSYTTLKDGTEKICLGGAFYYTMQALFDLFELRSRGEWMPFGVIDDDVSDIIRDVEKAVDTAGEL